MVEVSKCVSNFTFQILFLFSRDSFRSDAGPADRSMRYDVPTGGIVPILSLLDICFPARYVYWHCQPLDASSSVCIKYHQHNQIQSLHGRINKLILLSSTQKVFQWFMTDSSFWNGTVCIFWRICEDDLNNPYIIPRFNMFLCSSLMTGSDSHKMIDLAGNPILRHYYTNRVRSECCIYCIYICIFSFLNLIVARMCSGNVRI